MRKDNKTLFSQYYSWNKRRKEIRDTSLSLIIGGFVVTALSLLKMIVNEGIVAAISMAAAIVGVALIVAGTVFPQQMVPVTKQFSAVFNRIGVIVIKALLIPIYIFTFITTFWYVGIKKKAYRFERWEHEPPVQKTFFEKSNALQVRSKKAYAVIGSIFSEIAAHKMYILVPLIIVLLVVGLLFFFVSSSSVFSFIYTFI